MSTRKKLEAKLGTISNKEFEYALDRMVEIVEEHDARLFEETVLDMMATAVSEYRELGLEVEICH